jgi:uncharacterized protein with HEPN domain
MHGTENASCEKPSASPDWLFRIEDMLVAMRRIHEYKTGLSFSEFRSSPMRVEAVLYNFAVLGEAANHAARHARALHPDIEWDELRAMRNVVVHEIFGRSTRDGVADDPSRPAATCRAAGAHPPKRPRLGGRAE